MDPLVDVPLAGRIPPAEARHEREVFFGGDLHRLAKTAETGGVDRHRLFAEDLPASLDRGLEMQRAESGRGREQDDVTGIDHLLVAVEAGELALGWAVEPSLKRCVALGLFLDRAAEQAGAGLDVVGKRIGHRPEHDARVSGDRLRGGARAASTAANETDLEPVAACGVGHASDGVGEHAGRCGDRSGGRDKSAAGNVPWISGRSVVAGPHPFFVPREGLQAVSECFLRTLPDFLRF